MHIVYITPEFVTEMQGGGLATYLANISRIMRTHNHDITIITLSDYDDTYIWDQEIVVERVKRSNRNIPVPGALILQSGKLCKRLKKVNSRKPVDIVQYASYNAVGFFKARKIPGVVRISSDCVAWRELKVYDYDDKALERCCLTDWIEYFSMKTGRGIFGPSYATGQIIAKRVGREVKVIESPFLLKAEEYNYSLYDRLLKGKKYYLAHSSMSCLKGTHLIGDVIYDICERDENAYFVFAGSDHGIFWRNGLKESAKDYIMKRAGKYADRVIFLGTVERKSLYPVVEKAFACLMPSRIDNMPNTCIEAMAMGKIVIGTRGASYEQMIENGKSGYLIEIDKKEDLIKAIADLNNLTMEERAEMEKSAIYRTKRFEPEQIYQQLILYYNEILSRRKRK